MPNTLVQTFATKSIILNLIFLQIHEKYNKLPLRVAARALSWIAPRFYIPSRALALDPNDVIADEKDRFDVFFDLSGRLTRCGVILIYPITH